MTNLPLKLGPPVAPCPSAMASIFTWFPFLDQLKNMTRADKSGAQTHALPLLVEKESICIFNLWE